MRRLTVLGSCGARPEAGRACSGFLLTFDGMKIVLDLGFGTFSRLLTHTGTGAVDAVIITHSHSDHCVDLNALFRERCDAPDAPPVPLYCPPDVIDRIDPLEPNARLTDAFTLHELPGTHRIGALRCEGVLLPHHVPNAGIRLTAPGFVLAYTGDTGPDDALVQLAADADLFIADATFQDPPAGKRTLMTAREAGAAAAAAGVKRLLLTHFWPGSDRTLSVAQAAEHFDGEILAASEDLVIDL